MRILQALVIGMGVLIFVLLGVIVWRIATIATGGDDEEAAPPAAATAPQSDPFAGLSLNLDAGCRVAAIETDAGRLVIRTSGPRQACDAVHIYDLVTGEPLGTITP